MVCNEPFMPDWTVAPGESIRECLEQGRISVAELKVLGLSEEEIPLLLDGTLPLTERMAEKLSRLVGGTSEFWVSRERLFEEDLVRLGRSREGHVRRERDKARIVELLSNLAGDPSQLHEVQATVGRLLDKLHDEIEVKGKTGDGYRHTQRSH